MYKCEDKGENKNDIDLMGFISFEVHFDGAMPRATIISELAHITAIRKLRRNPHKWHSRAPCQIDILYTFLPEDNRNYY